MTQWSPCPVLLSTLVSALNHLKLDRPVFTSRLFQTVFLDTNSPSPLPPAEATLRLCTGFPPSFCLLIDPDLSWVPWGQGFSLKVKEYAFPIKVIVSVLCLIIPDKDKSWLHLTAQRAELFEHEVSLSKDFHLLL